MLCIYIKWPFKQTRFLCFLDIWNITVSITVENLDPSCFSESKPNLRSIFVDILDIPMDRVELDLNKQTNELLVKVTSHASEKPKILKTLKQRKKLTNRINSEINKYPDLKAKNLEVPSGGVSNTETTTTIGNLTQ